MITFIYFHLHLFQDVMFETAPMTNVTVSASGGSESSRYFFSTGYINQDALLAGNLYESEVETPRNDASFGTLLLGDGQGNFRGLFPEESGLFVRGEVRNVRTLNISTSNKKMLIFGKNNEELQMVAYPSKVPL